MDHLRLSTVAFSTTEGTASSGFVELVPQSVRRNSTVFNKILYHIAFYLPGVVKTMCSSSDKG